LTIVPFWHILSSLLILEAWPSHRGEFEYAE
jgi:hypothetical protein